MVSNERRRAATATAPRTRSAAVLPLAVHQNGEPSFATIAIDAQLVPHPTVSEKKA
jgi:hypothetical protein